MSYVVKKIEVYGIRCDKCGVQLRDDCQSWFVDENGSSYYPDADEADFGAGDNGWHMYDQPEGDELHFCENCVVEMSKKAKKAVM